MRKVIAFLICVISLISPIITIVRGIEFDQNCGGYLKQTADANSVELAIERLEKAISYVEAKDLTTGYTSILWKTESDNIGFWYENLLTCRDELNDCINSSQFEKTNVLMKVRESLTDNGEKGTTLTVPNGISRYPNNGVFAIFNTISVLLFVFGCCLFDEYLLF